MSSLPVLAANARELRNGLLREPRRRVTLLFALAINLALGAWGASRLGSSLALWQAASPGELARHLWTLCLGIWGAAAGVSLITVRDRGFGDRARLLFTLPVPRAVRVRALAGLCALQMANGLGLAGAFLLAALVRGLGARGAVWGLLALAGTGVVLWLVLVLQMGFIVAARPGWRRRTAAAGAVLVAAAAGALLAGRGRGTGLPPPVPAVVGAALLLLVVSGPLAGAVGRLYEAAFHVQEAGATRVRPRRLLRRLTRPLASRRGPAAALVVREALVRGRHWAEWLRAGLLAAGLLIGFPVLRPVLAARGVSGVPAVAAAVVVAMLFYVFDGATSPLGSEGSRLLHLLTAPMSLGALLRAKLLAFLLPLLAAGGAAVVALAAAGGLSAAETGLALAATGLVFTIVAVVITLGSAWDVDLDLEIEPGLRGYVQETAPLSAPRMTVFALACLAAAASLWLLWQLPAVYALAAVAGGGGLLFVALERAAGSVLRRRLREG